jgi:hypothetical protein
MIHIKFSGWSPTGEFGPRVILFAPPIKDGKTPADQLQEILIL